MLRGWYFHARSQQSQRFPWETELLPREPRLYYGNNWTGYYFVCWHEHYLMWKQTWNIRTETVHKHGPAAILHYHSHVKKRYKGCFLSTMINRAYRLSSTPTAFSKECDKLQTTFLNLVYPVNLINSSISKFLCNIDNIIALIAWWCKWRHP